MAELKPIATRLAFGEELAEVGGREDIIVLDADLSKSTMTYIFKEKYPERFVNCGIAEGNMMTTAAGIASTGKRVFAASFAMFSSGRAYDQLRNSVAYPELNVCAVGSHARHTVGEDGASHQCIEDVALMRAMPNMTVISPADGTETRAALRAIVDYKGPVYLRVCRLAMPILFDPDEYGKFEIGKGRILKEGSDIAIIGSGLLLHEAVKAVEALEAEGISVRLVDIATIKPLDEALVIESAKKCGAVLVCEEHNVIGGLGSAVAETLSKNCPTIMDIIGVKDTFGCSGEPMQLLDKYEMSAPYIEKAAKALIAKK